MTDKPAPPPRRDLTLWNRAGLRRFSYVDGNAATWLEAMRLAMLARFMRGANDGEHDVRSDTFWREVFATPPTGTKLAAATEALRLLQWEALVDTEQEPPAAPLSSIARNERLASRYSARSGDLAMEMLRATSRAAHVLTGHIDAYANEGYLRTATQWESLRKLTAMIGYHPAPGAAASTVVGLILGDDAIGTVEIARGIPISYSPSGGGKPVIFETIDGILAHRALSAARLKGHDINEDPFDAVKASDFILPKGGVVKPGDLAVLVNGDKQAAAYVAQAEIDADRGKVTLSFELGNDQVEAKVGNIVVHARPEKVQRPLLRSSATSTVFESDRALQLGDVVYLVVEGQSAQSYRVSAVEGLRFEIEVPKKVEFANSVQFSLASQHLLTRSLDLPEEQRSFVSGNVVRTAASVKQLDFLVGRDIKVRTPVGYIDGNGAIQPWLLAEGSPEQLLKTANLFEIPERASEAAFAPSPTSINAFKVEEMPPIFAKPSQGKNQGKVEFAGKPSPALVAGARFIARPPDGELVELTVRSLRIGPESHFVEFESNLPPGGSRVEYHGPMSLTLRPVDHDKGQEPVQGAPLRVDVPGAAAVLVKVGAHLIIEDAQGALGPAQMTVASTETTNDGLLEIRTVEGFETSGPELADYTNGRAILRLNTVRATHGETRGTRVLGSGNAELGRQTFNLPIRDITFVPSSVSETGVVPDVDMVVQDVIWAYRDLGDPDAEGTDSWSYVLRDDDTLDVVFRRRLPTGIDNVMLRRHRVGSGPAGNALPARAVTKPSTPRTYVAALSQPFAAAGGSDREPVAMLRQAAPSRLVANGRAVSQSDFPRLLGRHASVQEAVLLDRPSKSGRLVLVVVPADGEIVSDALKDILADYMHDRSAPGARVEIRPFRPAAMRVEATLRIDARRYDKDDVMLAAKGLLLTRFGLRHRRLGQALTIGQVLAALEEIDGIENTRARLRPGPRVDRMLTRFLPSGDRFEPGEELVFRAGRGDVRKAAVDELVYVNDVAFTVEPIA